MYVHGKVPRSEVNGPGRRIVIWFQGCSLACPGCWNPETHSFATNEPITPEALAEWILSCRDVEGVTFSGGEPFQQALALLRVCSLIKQASPDFSIGIFSGYTLGELEAGRFQYHQDEDAQWHRGSPELFQKIRRYLDFGIFGRFSKRLLTRDLPLCGSSNQQVRFFSDRYSLADLRPQAVEILISEDGREATFTGFPTSELLTVLTQG